jgi:hypothetical protein
MKDGRALTTPRTTGRSSKQMGNTVVETTLASTVGAVVGSSIAAVFAWRKGTLSPKMYALHGAANGAVLLGALGCT